MNHITMRDARSAMLFTYSILTTSCVLQSGALVSPNSEKCNDFSEQNSTLKECRLLWPEISCVVNVDLKNQDTSIEENLRFTFQFRVLNYVREEANLSESSSARDNELVKHHLSLEAITITKEPPSEDGYHSHNISRNASLPFLLKLVGYDGIRIESTFNSSCPVAQSHFRKTTLTGNRYARLPAVQVLPDINIAEVEFDNGLFSEKLRSLLIGPLHGKVRLLHLILSTGFKVNTSATLGNLGELGVEDLKVNGAQWPHLGRNTLPFTPRLFRLDVSNNGLEVIAEDSFERTPFLQSLNISNNKLLKLPSSLSRLKSLEVLDLSSNPSLQFNSSSETLRFLTNLKWLNLSHIPLKTFKSLGQFIQRGNYMELLGIQLINCDIVISEENLTTFDNMPSLVELDLSQNDLTKVPSQMFSKLKNLQTLRLASNRLSNISLNTSNLKNLELIDLTNNKITSIFNIKITGNVTEINLSDNTVLPWDSELCEIYFTSSNQWLKRLNLSYNLISYISESMIKSFSTLDFIDLGGNSFDCDNCNMVPFQTWLSENKTINILNLGCTENLKCGDLRHLSKNIIDVKVNATSCPAEDDTDWSLIVGVPLLVCAALILFTVIAVFGYRYEITYIRHLINIRRQRHFRDSQSIARFNAADRDWVMKELQPHLEQGAEKYRLCLHERDFALGSIIADNIVESMKDSRSTLVVLTPHFVKSQWCRWELEVANHKLFQDDREFLILVELKKLDRKTLPKHLAYMVETRTYLEWPKGQGTHTRAWGRLKYALGESLYQRRLRDRVKGKDVESNDDVQELE
ncbi:hypothetical protein C0J52_16712 [Blattella germanica]|nr:hypothetical protein C0J52_16712 [Blattella germanica]